MKEKITIDSLARMTQNEFSQMGKRFDRVDEKFDEIDQHLVKMDATLKTVLDVVLEIPSKKAIERLENRVNVMDSQLTSIERKISDK